MAEWDNVICVPEKDHEALVRERWFYRLASRVAIYTAVLLGVLSIVFAAYVNHQADMLLATSRELHLTQRNYERSTVALAALARSHKEVLDARQQINDVGQKSWARRFTVTKYTPSAGGINAFGDGKHTSTMHKADPKARIVAVDPALIPYGSWVWIEDMGWFQAQDCGGMIKGFRLDVMNANVNDAFRYGKQKRFAIIVPKSGGSV